MSGVKTTVGLKRDKWLKKDRIGGMNEEDREGKREGKREGEREGGREGEREGQRVRGRRRWRVRRKEEGRDKVMLTNFILIIYSHSPYLFYSLQGM